MRTTLSNSSSSSSGGGNNSSSPQQLQLHQLPIRTAANTNMNNNNSSSFMSSSSASPSGAAPPAAGIDHRPDVEFAHEQVKSLIERNRQYYESELSRREVYIDQLQTDFRHNIAVAQEHQNENERLRLEVEELQRELGKSERTVKELAEANGALSESVTRLRSELDEAMRRSDQNVSQARSDAASGMRSLEAEQARAAGEARAREAALAEEHERETAQLRQRHSEVEGLLQERAATLEQERAALEEKVSGLERKLSAATSEKTSSGHALAVVRRREEELEGRLREAARKVDAAEMELSRLRDENIALAVEKDSRKAEWQDSLDAQGRNSMERLTSLTAQCSKLTQSECSLKELTANLKEQLEHERSVRRKENDEADLRVLAMKKEIDSAREAAAQSSSSSQREMHDERRKLVEELNDQLAEALKQTRRADDLERRVSQAGFEASLAQQRTDALSGELSSQREQFRADTLRLQQLHQEDAERWAEEAAKMRRSMASSEEARRTLEAVVQDHVERERASATVADEKERLAQRCKELEEENDKVRAVVREVTSEMQSDQILLNVKQQAERIVLLEAELARSKNSALELDVRLQATEMELREERRDGDAKKEQFAETVKNLSSDAAALRQMLQDERARKNSFVDATLAGVSKWTATATSVRSSVDSTSAGAGGKTQQTAQHGPAADDLEADAAASSLADRLDTQSLQHELSRLELVVSTQQKQLTDLVSQRAGHVAQIADLKSMFEAVSQDRQSLVEMNNALRTEARAAEAEVARLRGEVHGLRQALGKVRGQQALDRVKSPNREPQQQQQHFPPGKMLRNQGTNENVASGGATRATKPSSSMMNRQQQQQQQQQHRRTMSNASTGSGSAAAAAAAGSSSAGVHRRGNIGAVRNYNMMDA